MRRAVVAQRRKRVVETEVVAGVLAAQLLLLYHAVGLHRPAVPRTSPAAAGFCFKNAMLVKLWCVLHNISIRSNTSKFHDTFAVDLEGNGSGLKIAQMLNPSSRLDLKAQFSNARCTFSVGSYTGGQLTFQTSTTWPSDLEINIFSQSYVLSTT